MAIRGNLSEASLSDVLQLLALGQKSGVLSIAREGSFGSVHFAQGRIVFAGVVNRRDRLGDRLVRHGVLTADALTRIAAARSPHDDRELADALVDHAAVDLAALTTHYRALVEEAVYHLFAWNTGTFTFEPEVAPADREPLVSIHADSLLLEGARRVDEWALIERKIPSLDVIFELDARRLAESQAALHGVQERVLPLVDGANDVQTIIERSGLDELEVGKALFGLVTAGFAHRVGKSAAKRNAPPESRVAEHRNLGVAFYRTGLLDEAQREFRRVLELRDSDGAARFHLGLIALRRGAWADAVLLFERGAEAPDAPAAVFHNLAYARERMHRLDAADDALSACAVVTASGGAAGNRGASAAASADPRTLVSAAMLAVLRGAFETVDVRLAEARAAWGARQPNAVWYHVAALAAALRGDLHGATAVLEEGIALYPHAVPLHNNLAVIQERAGLHESAARTLEHALLEHGSDPTLHKNLGDFHYRAQRYDDALVAFERTARLAPRHGADVFLKLGNIHYRRGATHEARTAWGKALELEPDHRIVRANLDVLLRAEQAMTADAAAAIAAVSA